jgi:hypothetical protein
LPLLCGNKKQIDMKKLLVLVTVVGLFTSCQKEEIPLPVIGCKCSDGALIPYTTKESCSTPYRFTYAKEIVINGVKTGKWQTVTETKTHGTFVSFLYGKGTFCDNYPSSIYCLGQNY